MSAKHVSNEQKSRENVKNKQREEKKAKSSSKKRIRVRLIPIWLRILIIIFLTAVCLIAGILVGYSVVGDGKPQDALKKATWTHIIDLVKKEK